MFSLSGRWDGSLKRDSEGRIFLDYDHELIEAIINYLRMKKVEDPSNPLELPYVATHKVKDFERLLEYFGLVDYFNHAPSSSTTMIFPAANFVQYEGLDFVKVTQNNSNTVRLVKKEGTNGPYGVAHTIELDPSGEGCFWKVNIDSLPCNNHFFLGILGNLKLQYFLPTDPTSIGWGGTSCVFRKGQSETGKDGWSGFAQGECLYFHFKSNELCMHSIQKNKTFFIGIDANAPKYYFHTNIVYSGTAMTIGPLTAEERKTFTDYGY